jgi:hypothetical protein
MSPDPEPRRVVIVAFDGVQPLDVVGPAEVFSYAGAISRGPAEYRARFGAPAAQVALQPTKERS